MLWLAVNDQITYRTVDITQCIEYRVAIVHGLCLLLVAPSVERNKCCCVYSITELPCVSIWRQIVKQKTFIAAIVLLRLWPVNFWNVLIAPQIAFSWLD